ncbi:MAG: HEAT repeat domain-containing protein [Candidatus Zixiibacteriota bacterium]
MNRRIVLVALITILSTPAAVKASDDGAWIVPPSGRSLLAAVDEPVKVKVADSVRVAVKRAVRDSIGVELEAAAYEAATESLDDEQWDQAIRQYQHVIRLAGRYAPGATYWKAYAQYKSARRAAALETLAALHAAYPDSRWEREAKALELEIRQTSGRMFTDVEREDNDEDLKLLILSNLMNTEPERAVPLLEKVLKGNSSLRVKEQALFVLSQSGTPQAREVLALYARGESNPDLQMRAVSYLGIFGGEENRRLLEDVYSSAASTDVKRKILESYMVAGDEGRLLAIARKERDADLRRSAIEQLGVMGQTEALWQLYQQEPDSDLRRRLIESFMISGDSERLLAIAKREKDPDLRRSAIEQLSVMGETDALWELYQQESDRDLRRRLVEGFMIAGANDRLLEVARREGDIDLRRKAIEQLGILGDTEPLHELYTRESSPDIKSSIIDALFIHGDDDGLIAIARAEKDRDLRRQAVEKLALLNSDAATDFLMELLEK